MNTVILDQWPRAEMARFECAEPAGVAAESDSAACHPGRRTRDAVTGQVEICEARARKSDIEIKPKPGQRLILVDPLHSDAAAGPARLGGAGIADEQEFRIKVEQKDCQRA